MTIKQLIDALQKLAPDTIVYTEDGEGHDYCIVNEVDFTAKITEQKETKRVVLRWKYEKDV